jgi:3-oxoadipate enol-lactonase
VTPVRSPAGVTLAARAGGPEDGRPVVLMHGLTMTRDHVLPGSTDLERAGHRVIAYDARGHGGSTAPRDPRAYGYDELVEDALAVMDAFDVDRAVLAGASMGAHTALRIALDHPERVAGLAVVTPGYDPDDHPSRRSLPEWDRLATALRMAGPEAFAASLELPGVRDATAKAIRRLTRDRLAQHADPAAVADAIVALPRSAPFGTLGELAAIEVPALVVGSRDRLDPAHPYALARRYVAAIPRGRFACEPEGALPLAWDGRRLSALVGELARAAAWDTRAMLAVCP